MEEDLELPLKLALELVTMASKKMNATKYQYFVDRLNEISPEYRFKLFYNLSTQIAPFVQSNPNFKPRCSDCGSEKIEFVPK